MKYNFGREAWLHFGNNGGDLLSLIFDKNFVKAKARVKQFLNR